MLIQKKRIRNIDNYIPNFDGRDIYIAHSLPDAGKRTLLVSQVKEL